MKQIYFVHWNAAEAKEKAGRLEKIGYQVKYDIPSPEIFREIRKKAPDIFLIDLTRLPSHGRDVALSFRQSRATRFVPLVFVDGDSEKVEKIKEHLPDATYATWGSIKSALKKAISIPPENPIVPRTALEGYANAPLVKKLGIKANSTIALLGAPFGFKALLPSLPDGVKFGTSISAKCDLVISFVKREKDYRGQLSRIKTKLGENSGLWIAWPKKSSGVNSDLTQNSVRKIGLASGLVDYKICSIDDIWSGLKFKIRR